MEVIVQVNEEYLEDFLKNLKHYDKNYILGYRFEPNEILKRDVYNSLGDIKNKKRIGRLYSESLSIYVTETFLSLIEHLDEKFGFTIRQTFNKLVQNIKTDQLLSDINNLDIQTTKGLLTNMVEGDYTVSFNYMKLSNSEICFFIALPMTAINQETLSGLDLIINQMYYKHWEF